MFYGDYSYELVNQRMETTLRYHEHHKLVKQMRLASKGSGSGLVARSSALIMSLFR